MMMMFINNMACNQSANLLNSTECFHITKAENTRIKVIGERPLEFKWEDNKMLFNMKDIDKNSINSKCSTGIKC